MNITQHFLYDFAKKGEFKTLKAVLEVTPKLEKIAVLNTLDEEKGWSPLHYAIEKGRLDIVQLLLQHGTNPNLRNGYFKPLMIFAISDLVDRPYALSEEIVGLLLDYNADPTLCMNNRINALYSAIEMANFRAIYCLLNHPKVKRDLKEDLLFTFETREGHTALHKLVKALIVFSENDFFFSEELFENFKRCLYAFLLSGIDVKEKLPTLVSHLGLGDEEYSRVNYLITEAEDFIVQMKEAFGFLGEEVVHRCIFSSEQEREAFKKESDAFLYEMNERKKTTNSDIVNRKNKNNKVLSTELEILVTKHLAPSSIHFFPTHRSRDESPSIDATSDVSRLTL